jgi:chromate transporter
MTFRSPSKAAAPAEGAPAPGRTSLAELARLFLKLGTIAFGGPAAHVAMMEDEVVRRRRWLSRQEFLDLLGATNLIPGPNSTELAMHVGRARAGGAGLVVAGTCFILPAALIVTALARAYLRFGTLPEAAHLLYGVKAVVIAVVVQALWRLGRTAARTPWLATVGVLATAAAAAGVSEILVLLGAGVTTAATRKLAGHDGLDAGGRPGVLGLLALAQVGAGAAAGSAPGSAAGIALWPLFAFFLKVGSVLFGSGYVLLAFLRSGLVVERGWLTEPQLLDAVAIGQVTPGPVFTTATFIGYLLAGGGGAAVATIGIFLPAFLLVALSGPLVPALRRSVAAAVLDGVNVASLALMAVVTVQLARAALVDPLTIALAVGSAILLFRFGVNSAWLVLAGAAVGVIAR